MLRMEVMNALQRLVFESRTGNQPLRVRRKRRSSLPESSTINWLPASFCGG
jgi:hypothetical protein